MDGGCWLTSVRAQVFDEGTVRLVVGGGGYLPALHKALLSMSAGQVPILPPPPTFRPPARA